MEIWKPVKGYEGIYSVSSLGRVRSESRVVPRCGHGGRVSVQEKIRKLLVLKKGYFGVPLRRDGERKNARVHRLVAEAFIPNPENKPQVNHKNGDKTDNQVENLEWVDNGENQRHAYSTGIKEKTDMSYKWIPVEALDSNGNVVHSFLSMTHAEKEGGFSCSKICLVLQGKRFRHAGYFWRRKS